MRYGSNSKELLMTMKNRTGCIIIAFLLCGAAPALAQTTPSTPQHIPLQKTIGQQDKPEIVLSLIVMNARGAWYRGAAVGAAAVGAAAVGAAPAGAYPYYGAACGYYPTRLATEATPGHQEANASPGHRRI
jgi:hypothetical protein